MDYKLLLERLLQITVWLPIKNYDYYEVSICGQVKNVITNKILNPWIGNYGYYCVGLYKNKNKKDYLIHRLVANAFIPNIKNDEFIDHKNNNKLDNTISNLRWVTKQQNSFNSLLSSKNTSGIKGIGYNEKNLKWECYLRFNYKHIHLGLFKNINDANIARQKKSAELFGEYINSCELQISLKMFKFNKKIKITI